MTPYFILLFDADNTLFNFDAGNRRAFSEVCRICHLPDTDELFHAYETVNAEMWSAFDRGECTKDFLVVERFRLFLERAGLQADPVQCNKIHLSTLATNTVLLPHALEVCRSLAQTHSLYIVTNAVAAVQKARLAASDLRPYITDAFISEDAGASKPSVAYFDYVFSRIPGITRENCLLIGDSPSSDLQGANNYGIPCCWYNPRGLARPDGMRIDYEIRDLPELLPIVDL